jgi:hypothetical protein
MISVDGPIARPGVTPSWMSGLPALPIGADAAVAHADVRLHDAPVVEDDDVGDDEIGCAAGPRHLRLSLPVAMTLPPPKVTSSP